MRENALFEIIFNALNAGLVARGILNVTSMQAYQPDQEGMPSGPTVLVHKLFDTAVGFKRTGTQKVLRPPTGWDGGATTWDNGATIWDGPVTLWDDGNTAWDDGATIWDGDYALQHVESQAWQTTYQVNALAIQDPLASGNPTAGDILRAAHSTMQSDATIKLLRQSGVGILFIRDIKNTPFVDDKQRNEFNPSFDFALTHNDTTVTSIDAIVSVEHRVYRV